MGSTDHITSQQGRHRGRHHARARWNWVGRGAGDPRQKDDGAHEGGDARLWLLLWLLLLVWLLVWLLLVWLLLVWLLLGWLKQGIHGEDACGWLLLLLLNWLALCGGWR